MSILCITGTTTGIGKTITTAMMASQAHRLKIPTTVCKPVQTGIDNDLQQIQYFSGITRHIGIRHYPEALAPVTAATRAGLPLPSPEELISTISAHNQDHNLVLIEGAGGLLVQLGLSHYTLRDLARDLHAPILIVTGSGLGTLNTTELTLEAIHHHQITCAGLVIGSWSKQPGIIEETNRAALAELAPLRAVLPEGINTWTPEQFQQFSDTAFCPEWLTSLTNLPTIPSETI